MSKLNRTSSNLKLHHISMNPSSTSLLANNQRPLTIWFLFRWATVMTTCFVAHSNRLSTLSLCLESLRNRYAFKFKIAPHKQTSIVNNKALCLNSPKHNGKSGTACFIYFHIVVNIERTAKLMLIFPAQIVLSNFGLKLKTNPFLSVIIFECKRIMF